MSLEPCLQSACRISPHNRYNGCMKPIIFLSVLTLAVVAIGGGFMLTLLNELPPMTQYGVWPYWMLGAAIVIVILLAILFLVSCSTARVTMITKSLNPKTLTIGTTKTNVWATEFIPYVAHKTRAIPLFRSLNQ